MDPDFSRLDASLAERGVDGYLIDADSENADQYYLSGFDAPDPFVTLYDGEVHLLFGRSLGTGERSARPAPRPSSGTSTSTIARRSPSTPGADEAPFHVLAAFLRSYGVESVAVPPRFPVSVADALRDLEITVEPDQDSVVTDVRATKTGEEVELIRDAQAANETAMATTERLFREASVDGDGTLIHDGDVHQRARQGGDRGDAAAERLRTRPDHRRRRVERRGPHDRGAVRSGPTSPSSSTSSRGTRPRSTTAT